MAALIGSAAPSPFGSWGAEFMNPLHNYFNWIFQISGRVRVINTQCWGKLAFGIIGGWGGSGGSLFQFWSHQHIQMLQVFFIIGPQFSEDWCSNRLHPPTCISTNLQHSAKATCSRTSAEKVYAAVKQACERLTSASHWDGLLVKKYPPRCRRRKKKL